MVFAYCWQSSNETASKYKNKIYMFLTFLPLFIVNAGMYYVGTDYFEYFKYFQMLSSTTTFHMDIGFELICKFLKYNGFSFQWIYVITSLLGYMLIILCTRKYSNNYMSTYFWYFAYTFMYLLGFNLIRQFVALFMAWYAIDYIYRKSFFKYVICVSIASCFHFTALIMLPVYFIFDKRLKLSFWLVISTICGSFYIFYADILTWLFKTFKPSYLNSNYVSKELEIDYSYVICHLITAIIIFLYYQRATEKGEKDNVKTCRMKERNLIFINSILLGNIINIFCMWLPIYKRFAVFYLMPVIWVLPNIIALEKNKKIKWTIIIIQALSCLYYLSRYVGHWYVIPYRSIFSQWF